VIAERVAGVPEVANCLTRRMHKGLNTTLDEGQTPIVEVCAPLTGNAYADNASEESKLVPERRDLEPGVLPFDTTQITSKANRSQPKPGDPCHPLAAGAHAPSIAFAIQERAVCENPKAGPDGVGVRADDCADTLEARQVPQAVAFNIHSANSCAMRSAGESQAALETELARAVDTQGFSANQGGTVALTQAYTLHGSRAGSGGSSRSYVAQKAESEGQRAESSEAFAFHENQRGELTVNDTAGSLKIGGGKPGQGYPAVAYTLHGSREGTQAVASPTDTVGTIREGTGTAIQNSSTTVALSEVAQPLRSNPHNNSDPSMEATMHVLSLSPSLPVSSSPSLATQWRVRRLTPEECEMLQGFPVGYTLIPGTSSKKRKGHDLSDTIDYLISLGVAPAEAEVLAHSPDGPRYKALGNSWAVPVARWIARRIDALLSNPHSLRPV